jgi:hypothetical protein
MLGDGVCSNEAVIRVFRARVRALGLTYETVDAISGLTRGYTQKLLSEPPAADMGLDAMWAIAGALGIGFVPIVDHRQVALVEGRWVKRKRAAYSALECVSHANEMLSASDHGEAHSRSADRGQDRGSTPERVGGGGR